MNEQEQLETLTLLERFILHFCTSEERDTITQFVLKLAEVKNISEEQAIFSFAYVRVSGYNSCLCFGKYIRL